MESVCTLDTLSSESFFFGFVTMHETTTRSATRPPLRASGGGEFQRQCAPTYDYPAGSGAWHRAGFAHSVKAYGVVWTLRHSTSRPP